MSFEGGIPIALPHPLRLRDLKLLLGRGEAIGIAEMARQSRTEMYDRDGLFLRFAAAWALVHFVRSGKSPEDARRLDLYVASLLDGASPVEAFERSFGDCDLTALEARVREYVFGLKEP